MRGGQPESYRPRRPDLADVLQGLPDALWRLPGTGWRVTRGGAGWAEPAGRFDTGRDGGVTCGGLAAGGGPEGGSGLRGAMVLIDPIRRVAGTETFCAGSRTGNRETSRNNAAEKRADGVTFVALRVSKLATITA